MVAARHSSHLCLLTGLLLVGGVSACTGLREIDPPATPDRVEPQVEDPREPVKAHRGRLVIDAVGGPAQVDEVTSMTAGFEENNHRGHQTEISTRPLCAATPCVVDLGVGFHILRYSRKGSDFSKTSLTTAEVGSGRSVIRHDLGYYQTHKSLNSIGGGLQTVGIISATLGVPFLLASLLPLGSLVDSQKQVTEVRDGLQTAGLAMMVSGAGLLIVGEVLKILGRTEYQRGSTTQWSVTTTRPTLPPPPPLPPPVVAAPATPDAGAPPSPSMLGDAGAPTPSTNSAPDAGSAPHAH